MSDLLVCMWTMCGAKSSSDSLKLELQTVVSHLEHAGKWTLEQQCSQLLNHLFEISTVAVLFSQLSAYNTYIGLFVWRLEFEGGILLKYVLLFWDKVSHWNWSSLICWMDWSANLQDLSVFASSKRPGFDGSAANTLLTEPSLSASGLLFCKLHYKHLL